MICLVNSAREEKRITRTTMHLHANVSGVNAGEIFVGILRISQVAQEETYQVSENIDCFSE